MTKLRKRLFLDKGEDSCLVGWGWTDGHGQTCSPKRGFEILKNLKLFELSFQTKLTNRNRLLFLQWASINTVLLTQYLWKKTDLSELGECLHKMYFHITCQFCFIRLIELLQMHNSTPFHLRSNCSVESKRMFPNTESI